MCKQLGAAPPRSNVKALKDASGVKLKTRLIGGNRTDAFLKRVCAFLKDFTIEYCSMGRLKKPGVTQCCVSVMAVTNVTQFAK